ncbi:hypothetical protein KDW_30550 [Dictyobacter vulcani]|uniref:HTH merR-type domain-containing protein n=1 Tax=Dictyobacter vulcani TaxID=2607529 RepID=A0A5J4KMC9_9CHLR|nr:helix-turn-helix domain-containing protein [Dictyobacter vulcani]GER88893.1 hypothetical protein KDW_30550 [Dictyobacter vulcani]
MKLGELSKFYYTAAETRKALGIDQDTLQYWARKGRITKVFLPGRSQAVYSRKEIDELADQIEAVILAEQPKTIVFRKATVNDLDQEAQLAHLVFGEKAEMRDQRRAFLEKNPDTDYHLYDQGTLVAYINVVPMEHQTIESFMQGELGNIWNIDLNAIQQFEPEKPTECLIIDMVTTPTVPPAKRSFYGSRLLIGLANLLADLGSRGINITKVYSASRTHTGIQILQNAGFEVIHDSGNGRFSFMLDTETSDERILRKYRENLQVWKDGKVVQIADNLMSEGIKAKQSTKARSRSGRIKNQPHLLCESGGTWYRSACRARSEQS